MAVLLKLSNILMNDFQVGICRGYNLKHLKYLRTINHRHIQEISGKLWAATLQQGDRCCGSVGRVVASDTSGPQFESSQRQKSFIDHFFTVSCIKDEKIKRGRGFEALTR